jgi:hypothetical protein
MRHEHDPGFFAFLHDVRNGQLGAHRTRKEGLRRILPFAAPDAKVPSLRGGEDNLALCTAIWVYYHRHTLSGMRDENLTTRFYSERGRGGRGHA